MEENIQISRIITESKCDNVQRPYLFSVASFVFLFFSFFLFGFKFFEFGLLVFAASFITAIVGFVLLFKIKKANLGEKNKSIFKFTKGLQIVTLTIISLLIIYAIADIISVGNEEDFGR